jgi:uncharacterized protein
MQIQRIQHKELLNRLKANRDFIQVIIGPRQVGKTTMIQQVLSNINKPQINVSADDVAATNNTWIDQQWENARLRLANEGAKFVIIAIDEIQKINNWSEAIKKNWDADTKNKLDIRVVISGSRKLLIQNGLTESLAGRFEVIKMPHWSFAEMQEAFDISAEEYTYFGAYPGAAALIKNEKRWKRYLIDSLIETTISKDILMMNKIDKPALLRQLFEVASTYSTSELSYNKLLAQLQNAGNTTTLAHYINLLNSAQILAGLNKYSGSAVRQRNSSPKFQVYNTAFFTTYNALSFKEAQQKPDLWGRWVENVIGAHLLNAASQYDFELMYWRDGNNEVDYVLQNGTQVIGIEVKSGNRLKSSGIAQLQQKHKIDKVLLLGTEGLHWTKFIKMDVRKLF